jgi:hypothetical protein
MLFQAARPAILNGIEDVITRPYLADRAIFLTLPYVQEVRRRLEKEIWRQFEIAHPQIFGALLEAARHGLRKLRDVRQQRLPRMADFALWATACECVQRKPQGRDRADPWPLRCAASWPSRPRGRATRPTFCAPAPILQGITSRGGAQVGRNLPGRWPAACVAHKRRSGPWALRSPLAARGAGTRIIRISALRENPPRKTVSTVCNIVVNGRSGSGHPPPGVGPVSQACE